MKNDMAGAAAVLAAASLLGSLRPSRAIHMIVPAAENMTGPSAYRPGDVLKSLAGKTVEIGNTDAEGRLLLADAIAYAVKQGAREIVEMSTLTGACVAALGPHRAGVFGKDGRLLSGVLAAARRAGEETWRLPLAEELRQEVRGEVADLRNVGGKWGGAINGALFLREFAGKAGLVHVDIAGPAWADKATPLCPKGGTGYGVLTLAELLAAN
jgi:leucyl aminopeptidase